MQKVISSLYFKTSNVYPVQAVISPTFQFYCTPRMLDFPMPLAANQMFIGGIHMMKKENNAPNEKIQINTEMTSLIEKAENGFIIVGMGHWTTFHAAPPDVLSAFVDAFTKLAQNDYLIIWKYTGPEVPGLHENIKLVEWMPQKALLGG